VKTALVTGASRGIGRGLAAALAGEGMRVLLGARDVGRGREAAAGMRGRVEVVGLGVASRRSIEGCARAVEAPLDLLVNNAALYQVPAEELWPVNVHGPILLTRALADTLAADARVVNVTSGLGRLSAQSASLRKVLTDPAVKIDDLLALSPMGYGASKAVLNAFTRLLAEAWPGRAVNAVDPGWVKTDMGGRGAPREIEEGVRSVLLCCRIAAGGPSGKVWWDGEEIGA